ncbi:transcription initiation factor IIB [Natrarchaeobaculum sulfurireducens]|uniref:Transcription initiation factor IIB n=1 Tax=Natrarchaeobaculum sulfurireducens TaxID=2044521 RepID=A0A346PPF7_9EURY|nr:TFIIB-type zinc ribbon-containing protein [Natrarchaeobaculum sulfurireducens]AXR78546.1 Transcription initiation factor TFIIB [Natrarchaeobaculum sulfurireducens]AXR81402.1 Transcription initiation factor B [Natrarchaeobaculum sulfurireducens]
MPSTKYEHRRRTNASEREPDSGATGRQTTCLECDGRLRTGDDQVYCEECGLVVDEEQIDRGPEWRAFDAEERNAKSRVGAPTTTMLHDRGLSTRIDWRDTDGYGGALSNERRQQFRRLRLWDERFRTKDATDRNLQHALGEIDRMGSALGVPESACETASVIYRRALEEDLLPGRSIEGMSTAALYAAMRQAGIPRSVDELATVSRIDYLEATRSYRYLVRELELPVAPPDPLEYVPRYASRLEVSNETERRARELLETGIEAGVHSGKHPVGLAAAALYAASRLTNEDLTQGVVSATTDVSEVTIRNRYQELLELELVG